MTENKDYGFWCIAECNQNSKCEYQCNECKAAGVDTLVVAGAKPSEIMNQITNDYIKLEGMEPFKIVDMAKATPTEGLRFNEGKLRYDLLEPHAIEELVKVFTKGAEKYAPNNWQKGMQWSKVVASLKRHIAAFEKGEDTDPETSCMHMAHAAWNALALCSYYKMAPQYDDRNHAYLKQKKIGLDLDGVIISFQEGFCKAAGLDYYDPTHWNDPKIAEHFPTLAKDDEFWLNLPALTQPNEIGFEPHCYITSRSVDPAITKKWLTDRGYPEAPLYCVGFNESKVDIAKKSGIDIMVDDRVENFIELTNAGIFTYLYDQPYNRRIDVGYKRITSLKEIG